MWYAVLKCNVLLVFEWYVNVNVTCECLRTFMIWASLSAIGYWSLINTWMSYARMFWECVTKLSCVLNEWIEMSLLSSWLIKLWTKIYILSCIFTLSYIRYTYHTCIWYREKHSSPKNTFISYMHMDLRWFYGLKSMIYDLLVFKQVTRNGIFDSRSVCFESMSWLT